ncbi:pebp-like protein [Rhizoctonia solani]|uniref:Pebp-like protein n=1 Tax=Rhizoctonia solani TaxID=456999 RepID=A0A8H7IBI6_9AGAM|nr:pebp-like protein [Rhizoctonia solani]
MVKSQLLSSLLLASGASVLASPYAKYPTLSEVKKTFYSEGVVPDVIPSSKVVLPNTSFVRNGQSLGDKSHTLVPPEISVQGAKGGPYVVAIVDPDALSRASPTIAQIRHFLAANFTVSSTRSKYVPQSFVLKNSTAAVNDYRPPTPPVGSGPHRYVALLYSQPKNFDISFLNVSDIRLFNISSFAERTGLGEPLAGTFLTVEQKNTTAV